MSRILARTSFSGAPDGSPYPQNFAPGDVVEGDLAAVALREGWAEVETTEGDKQAAADAKAKAAAKPVSGKKAAQA